MVGFPGQPILVDYTDIKDTGMLACFVLIRLELRNKKPVEQTLHG